MRRPSGVQLRTLGCRLNQAESAEIQNTLAVHGVDPDAAYPEFVLVNTCTVTAEASKASRKLIRRSIVDHPQARIVVTGCYAVAEPQLIASLPGVDSVISNQDKDRIAGRIASNLGESTPISQAPKGPRCNLKVQTGCDELCSFCIVPQTRGKLASRDLDDVFWRAGAMVEAGVREIVLTGVNLGKYGWDMTGSHRLSHLVQKLSRIDGLGRIRLSSIEASQIDDELLETLASEPKVCRHLHIPLQTGDPGLWRRMRRPGTLEHLLAVSEKAKNLMDDLTLTTDVLVGSPGEDEEAFANTLAVIQSIGFRKLHVFRFSARAGTAAAAEIHHVDGSTARDRAERVRAAGNRLRTQWLDSQRGRLVRVLIEQAKPTGSETAGCYRLSGLTGNYLRVHAPGPPSAIGSMADVLVTSIRRDFVEGEIVG